MLFCVPFSKGSGMVLTFSDRPLGPSLMRMKAKGLVREFSTRYMKVGEFARNAMHSNHLVSGTMDQTNAKFAVLSISISHK